MIQEILTLVVEKIPTQYYINFEKDRKKFVFQPTLKNKSAPSFTIIVRNNELFCEVLSDEDVVQQAMEKVKEILSNSIYDRF
ncbi:MAG: hypothetical protein ACJ75F_01720 [Flavisolibacter sp.]|jgi:hypothetical protein